MADKTDDLVIGVSTDLSSVQRAIKKLDGDIARAGSQIERRFSQIGRGIDKAMPTAMQDRINKMVGVQVAATKEWTGALADQSREMERMRARFNPMFATITRYKTAVGEIRAAHRLGAISADEMTAAIQRERQAALASTAAIKGRNAAMAAGRPNAFNTANIAVQFQDIGVTTAMGMSPIQIALQQGTQLAAVLEQMKASGQGAGATLAAAFRSIISPMSLVTIGLIAASTAAAQYFFTTEDGAEATEKALKEQADLIQRVAQKWGEALPALKAYADEQERLASGADITRATQAAMARAFDEIGEMLPRLNRELSLFSAEAAGGGWGSTAEDNATRLANAYDAVEDAFAELNKAVNEGRDTTEEYKRLQEALTAFTTGSIVPASGALRDVVFEIADAYGVAAESAAEFARQAAEAASAEAAGAANRGRFPDARTTGRLTPTTGAALDDAAFAGRFGYDEYFNFPRDRKEKKPRAGSAPRRTADDRFFEDIEAIKQRTIALAEERAQLGLSYEAQVKRKTAFDLEQKALKDVREAARQKGDQDWQNAQLTPEQIQKIDEASAAYARQAEELRKAQNELSFQKDLMRGVLGDLKSALADGKLEWEEMGQIALNVLDKITDKLLNEVIDAIFQVNNAGSSGGLLGFLGGLFGGGGGFVPNTTAGAFFTNGFATGTANTGGARGQVRGVVHGQEAVIPLPNGGKVPVQIQAPQAPAFADVAGAGSVSAPVNINIDARGADREGLARVEQQVERLRRDLPATVVETVRKAQKGNVKLG